MSTQEKKGPEQPVKQRKKNRFVSRKKNKQVWADFYCPGYVNSGGPLCLCKRSKEDPLRTFDCAESGW